MNALSLRLIELAKQLEDMKPAESSTLTIIIDDYDEQPAVVVERATTGERIFVQNAQRTRLCRASYARDGGGK